MLLSAKENRYQYFNLKADKLISDVEPINRHITKTTYCIFRENFLISNLILGLSWYQNFWSHISIPIYNVASHWPRTNFFTSRVFLFSYSGNILH